MKRKLYILTALALATILFGSYSLYNMVLQCRTPYYIECAGKKLDSTTVIAISNSKSAGADTLNFNFEQSKVIMPTTLAHLHFNNTKGQFELKNNAQHIQCRQNSAGELFFTFLPYAD
ncbi:MAG: hypothetical protein IPN29_09920 [Saprospiraceae bacterium]|nr:hypothetical protein [Saprospiraceae bacterium]